MHSQSSDRRRPLGLVLVVAVGVIAVGAGLARREFGSPAVSPIASAQANAWLTPDGIARALAFRTSFGLRADDGWIRSVANDPRALDNVSTFSIPMTDVEVADFRTRLADRSAILVDLAQFGAQHVDTWGGYYVDADRLVVWLIDPSGAVEKELRAAIPPPFLVRQARWSLQELNERSSRVTADPWLQAHYHVLSAGADTEHNTVALEVSSADPVAAAAIAAHFGLGGELVVTIDGTGVAALPKGDIRGKGVDTNGKPAAGLDVQLVPDIRGADTGESLVPTTGDDGSFEIPNMPATGYVVRLLIGQDSTGVPNASPGTQVGEGRVEVNAGTSTSVTITVTWPVAVGGNASCVQIYSLETLAGRSWAYDATVTAVAGNQVTFRIGETFRGSAGDSVSVSALGQGGTDPTSEGGPAYVMGERYLISGEDDDVWGCGFSRHYDATTASQWRRVFGG